MINRRKFIHYTGIMFISLALPLPLLANESNITATHNISDQDVSRFLELSKFITEKTKLKQILAKSALFNLTLDDNDFLLKIQSLKAALLDNQIKNLADFKSHEIFQNPMIKDLAQKITGAWYLGYTGEPVDFSIVDNVRFVTYTDALMYQPTSDTTIIPSYSKAKPNYWFYPPQQSIKKL